MKTHPYSPIDPNQFKGDPNFMLSLARGVCVIEAFSGRTRPMTVADLARITCLDRAVVKRCLYTLAHLGIVEEHEKRFALSSSVLRLGHAYFSSSSVVVKSQDYLDQFGSIIYKNCAISLMNDWEVVYLTRFQRKRLVQQNIGLGSRLPAYCTSTGRVLLANLPCDEVSKYLDDVDRKLYTPYTVIDRDHLTGILEDIRENGFCIVDQEFELGLTAIAIPVEMRTFPESLALSVTADAKYTTGLKLKELYLERMREMAGLLSRL